ncbi:hypothetical protein VOLCADRAFT_100819 [Volvox carteri f. nagariensis]|uniref:Uncharacterized protein n=1 Tax=Volvox carteri f. nagariensis TaxID=3068 RepID=D8UL37_VOLCA|nr:uncharacterized protein VOLCADRAFT_100819 [Volvox carteri f. nagariensis]EFJ39563.1 hypothetical protein VOLCADRAFT_100819 [Volvox carteri f. nagariensis]|eukprot:XP_002959373.1 hypothetical protein VOLCADRAFT_100819 [Volvox carteri f. nagariensis]
MVPMRKLLRHKSRVDGDFRVTKRTTAPHPHPHLRPKSPTLTMYPDGSFTSRLSNTWTHSTTRTTIGGVVERVVCSSSGSSSSMGSNCSVLQQLRMDLSQQQAQDLLHNHREHLQLRTCSFGRRGRPSYAVRTQAEVQRLCHFANVSAHPVHDSMSETGTADTSSMLVDSQPARDSVGNVEPSRGTGPGPPLQQPRHQDQF